MNKELEENLEYERSNKREMSEKMSKMLAEKKEKDALITQLRDDLS